ncbi:LPD29 domain-containing protein [Bacillus xiapuensis]|uniref:Large polyvalent protein associated domain-containing protein n=1 Tax=Bacillus xiapuensis TaxID=2014075 RepID=A0ABU6N8B0_9BACI|nr:hypothetical protein [Bacillus xiapuensis]
MSVSMNINEELNGIELYFTSKPDQNVLSNLKSNGFRWSSFKKCWYTKQSEKAFNIANSLIGNIKEDIKEVKEIVKKAASKNVMSLWEATQWTELEINTDQDCKQIAKEIRTHIRKQFPQCKFSVTVPYYGKINFDIKSSPFEEGSVYLNAILNYCKNLLNAYQVCYDAGDSYSDIPASYNFYGWADVAWDYKQTEVTEQIKNEMADFDTNLAEFEKAEEEKKHQEFLQWQQEQELKNAEYQKQQEEENKQIENIYNSIETVELNENKQYFVIGSEFAHLNKNNTLDQYKEEISKGEFNLENVKITKEIHFNNKEALDNFSNMLLNDFDFLNNTGGSFTDDNRINSMTDYYNMDEYERNTVQWNRNGVAIYFEGKLQFVVDAQCYNYARYVGLTDNAKIEKSITVNQILNNEEITELKLQADQLEDISVNVIEELNIMETWENESWNEYKEAFKNKLKQYKIKLTKEIIQQIEIESLKVAMYKVLTEVDGIQDQFENASIEQGEKVTLFYISDWGSIVTNRITFDSVTNSKYAQYDNAVKLTFTPQNKRKLHYQYFHSTLLVFKGWHSLPDTVLNHVEVSNGMVTTRSKYHSCDDKQYDEILNYFEQQGIKAIVNTYKPTF